MDKLVDFSQPIEAVSGATVVPAQLVRGPDAWGEYRVSWEDSKDSWKRGLMWFDRRGRPVGSGQWEVRNVKRATALPAKPSTPSNEELTQRMEAGERAIALIERIARGQGSAPVWMADACSIVSDLPKPVDPIDPDEQAAIAIVQGHYPEAKDSYRGRRYTVALEAIKLGRTLAAGGTAHE